MFGQPLYRPPLPPAREARLQAQLDSATAEFKARPGDPDALLWVGRRLAYLGHYREAIAAYTRGISMYPADARFYRHRGHRYITCRQFDQAIADLELAATLVDGQQDEVEPDGQPNAAGVPRTTLQENIYYHLALAHYLRGELDRAATSWEKALTLARNDDMIVANSYWLYLTYRRLDRTVDAERVLDAIRPGMNILEDQPYLDLLLLFQGRSDPVALLNRATSTGQFATYGFGIASWYQFNGEKARAQRLLQDIVAQEDWTPFGFVAAETQLAGTGASP
jgi:tetratricopeptide (TPR) repeat protein